MSYFKKFESRKIIENNVFLSEYEKRFLMTIEMKQEPCGYKKARLVEIGVRV